jgi:hypothetical protein
MDDNCCEEYEYGVCQCNSFNSEPVVTMPLSIVSVNDESVKEHVEEATNNAPQEKTKRDRNILNCQQYRQAEIAREKIIREMEHKK